MGRYELETDCVSSTYEKISALCETLVPVSLRTLRRHCRGLGSWAKSVGYDSLDGKRGLSLGRDWAVSFHRGVYDGKRAYVVRWSAIEHIWTAAA